ncbi:hypothetical protein [Nonomuraea angiospora]|uniref:hypothetical protein n=1 Tax=Nonomuraea angiospora TaxID=46172 RepID=UPI0029AB6863|nr:hypothetical protein [Nonomuraea angiospora]MDX3102886.1 hypothetical protein [Nonomuraea angiospora]
MDRRKAGLAAGMVLVLTMGGSGALAASSQRDPADDPCAKAAACTPADIAKAKAAKAAELDGKCSPDVKRPDVKQPDVKQPEVQQPGVQKPEMQQPDVQKPGVQKQEQPKLVESGMLAKALAASLGVGLERATAAEEELNLLSQKGGINPKSPEFAAIAERLGVSAERLIQALDDFKRSFVQGEDIRPDAPKTPGS